LSSGKLSSCVRRCSFILVASSFVIDIDETSFDRL